MLQPSALPLSRMCLAAGAWGLLALCLSSCARPQSVACASGVVCSEGMVCSGDGQACIQTPCGDGILHPDEVCDDGNIRDGDGCNSLCQSTEECGNGILDLGEECDDGNTGNTDNCLKVGDRCAVAQCGDGFRDLKEPRVEECDPADPSQLCDSDCTLPACGDGLVNPLAGEECDDGQNGNDDACLDTCKRNLCGDGVLNRAPGGEVCDLGAQNGASTCPYGVRSCTGCALDCKSLLPGLTGPYCGDSVLSTWAGETCDDGNTDACGTCNATCTAAPSSTEATGSLLITLDGDALLGDSWALGDGTHLPVIFEFSQFGEAAPGHVPILISSFDLPEQVAAAIARTVNVQPSLDIRATSQGALVTLVNQATGAYGNQRILAPDSGSELQATGMSGGKGRDCPAGMGCSQNEDCAPGLRCLNTGACGE